MLFCLANRVSQLTDFRHLEVERNSSLLTDVSRKCGVLIQWLLYLTQNKSLKKIKNAAPLERDWNQTISTVEHWISAILSAELRPAYVCWKDRRKDIVGFFFLYVCSQWRKSRGILVKKKKEKNYKDIGEDLVLTAAMLFIHRRVSWILL